MRASQEGCMFPCSLEKIGVSPLFPKNKLPSVKYQRSEDDSPETNYLSNILYKYEIFANVFKKI